MPEVLVSQIMAEQAGSYCFNVVSTDSRTGTRPVTWHRDPRTFDGTAAEFAERMLADAMSGSSQLAAEYVVVNVWEARAGGVFDPAHIAGRAYHDPQAAIRRSAPVAGGILPQTRAALVLRTDFTDDAAWEALCAACAAPSPEGFSASLSFVSDPRFAGLTVDQAAALTTASYRTFFFVADHVTLTHPETPVAVADLHDEPGRWFRVVPGEMWGVENNLSLANMDFRDFAGAADPDGVFRGFPG